MYPLLLLTACLAAGEVPDPLPVIADPLPVVVAKAEKATVAKELATGWHIHRCSAGHEWSHEDHRRGNLAAHTCPLCGRVEWMPSQRGVKIVTSPVTPKPVTYYAFPQVVGTCPGGTCPRR